MRNEGQPNVLADDENRPSSGDRTVPAGCETVFGEMRVAMAAMERALRGANPDVDVILDEIGASETIEAVAERLDALHAAVRADAGGDLSRRMPKGLTPRTSATRMFLRI